MAGTGGTLPATKTVELTEAGKATFGKITYTEADAGKTYTYTITEDGFGKGWTGSPETITATVVVTDNGDGTLKTEVTYDPANATVTNTYEAEGEAEIEVIKALAGAEWPEGKKLTLTISSEDGKLPKATTVELTEAGKASFGKIVYDESDAGNTYTYVISEDGFGTGWEGSGNITAKVTVTDNGDGTLKTEVKYSPEDATITNTYSANGEATIKVTKALAGAEWPEDETLTFTLTGKDSAPMPKETTVTLGEEGNATFETIKYTEADAGKTYTYTVSEDGFGTGWSGSGDITVTVEVTDLGGGELATKVSYSDNGTIINTYEASGTAILEVTKAVSGAAWPEDGTITFTLSGKGGTLPEKTTVTLTKDGKATFDPITYTESDIDKSYTYTISEDGFGEGWTGSGDVTATVTVSDNGDGTLSTEVKYSPENATITNTYEAEGEAVIEVDKAIAGAEWPSGKTLTLTLAGEGGTLPEKKTVELTKAGKATFDAITYTESDIDKTYTYTVSEDGFGEGWTGSGNITAKVEVTDNGDGTLATKVTYSPESATITNTYKAEGEATIKVSKAIEAPEWAAQWPEGTTLTLTLTGSTGAPMPEKATATLSAAGEVSFGPIAYTEENAGKTYTYTVTEDGFGTNSGWTNETGSITVTVAVTDKGDGTLATEVKYAPESAKIVNTYNAEPVEVELLVNKTLNGYIDDKIVNKFEFVMTDPEDATDVIAKTEITAATVEGTTATGSATLYKHTYEEPGEFTYKITETKGDVSGIVYSTEEYLVTIKVEDDGNGALVAKINNVEVEGNKTDFDFTNEFKQKSVKVTLKVNKVIEDLSNSAEDGVFTFQLMDGDTVLQSKDVTTKDFKGSVDFNEIEYTEAGDYNYILKELTPDSYTEGNGWTYDTKEYPVVVTVSNNIETAQLEASVKIDGATTTELTVTNKYQAAETELALIVTKEIEDEADPDYEGEYSAKFSFTLEGDGDVKETKEITGEGTVAFSAIKYTQAGEYKYTITETKGDAAGFTYDTTAYPVTVTVTDKGGKLEAVPVYGTGEGSTTLKVTNKYSAKGEAEIIGSKTVEDKSKSAPDETFTFVLKKDGETVETVNAKAVKFSFSKLSFEKVGTYTYTVEEEAGSTDGFTYDKTKYEVTIKVTDPDKNGLLKTEVSYGEGKTSADFKNIYEAEPTETQFSVEKVLEGDAEYLSEDSVPEFTFRLTENNEVIDTKTVKGEGTVSFDTITYTEVGEHNYTIYEDTGDVDGFTYDTTKYQVKVVVSDNGGALTTVTTVDGETAKEVEVTFTNKFEFAPVTYDPPVKKTLKGDAPSTDATFEFVMAAVTEDAPMPEGSEDGSMTVSVTGEGETEFGDMVYTEPGTYVYTINEIDGKLARYTYDTSTYTLTVNVTVEGTELVIETTYEKDGEEAQTAEFVNRYEKEVPPPTDATRVTKLLTGFSVASMISVAGLMMIRKKREEEE